MCALATLPQVPHLIYIIPWCYFIAIQEPPRDCFHHENEGIISDRIMISECIPN